MPTTELDRCVNEDRGIGSTFLADWTNPHVLGATEIASTSLDRLQHFFERSADRSPGAIALICGMERFSYAELEARSNRLAQHLKHQGIVPGDRIGLLFERSANTYISLLAVLKCGGAYVPLDPSFPSERIAFIAGDSNLKLLLTGGNLTTNVSAIGCRVIDLDASASIIARASSARTILPIAADSLCCIIYTSGTTGRPKGVAVTQANMCNFLESCLPIYGYTASDRVYQGMTLAFDFSVEEVWPTFAVGATLVAGPSDHRRLGPGLAEFLIDQNITVMCCVPTLLATMDRDIPSLRLLLVGGEACPADIVKRWSKPGRRLLNTYGPTEATVTASWGELVPEKPVTIGRPMPSYSMHILDESLQPVTEGEAGEICIGGPGVAVGYINRPELTAERFVSDPFGACSCDRLYRTGDLGRVTLDGEVEYLGRIDGQVKIRGYRIELGEIEAVLMEDPAVAHALVALVAEEGTVPELVAYFTLRAPTDGSEIRQRLHGLLRCRLPAYMVPSYVEVLDTFPTLPSGKADRSRLPKPTGSRVAIGNEGEAVPPETPLEQELVAAWSRIFGCTISSVEADFFLDLGGHSLFAAMAVSDLRQKPHLRHVAIADIYAHPTIRGLALHLDRRELATSSATASHTERRRHSNTRVLAGGAGQMSLLYLSMIPWLAPTALMILILTSSLSAAWMIGGVVAAVAVSPMISLFLPVIAKWLLLPRVRPGRYPLWGWFFCRWWLVRKLLQTAPLDFMAGSPLLAPYLRLFGAKIGRGCHLGSGRIDLPELLEIGSGTCIGYDVDLDPVHVANGYLTVAPIRIGNNACIGTNCVISGGSTIGNGARITEQSLVASSQNVPDGETWAGSPSRRVAVDPQIEALAALQPAKRWSLPLLAGFFLGFLVLEMLPALLIVPGLVLVWGVSGGDLAVGLALTPLAGLLHVLATCAVVAVGKRLALPSLKPGVYPLGSLFGLRKWLADRLMVLSLGTTNSLYSTLYLLPFLRILGTRVGPRAEVSTVSHIDPDLLTLGTECFVADLAVIGAARFCNGFLVLGETSIGERAFIGNAALVPGDARLAHDSLIGVLSVTPPHPVEAGTSWLGSPAIFLPRRQASEKFDESLTYKPTKKLVACRLAIEFLRVILPSTLIFAVMFLFALAIMEMLEEWSLAIVILAMPALYFALGFVVTCVVAAFKWVVMGRYRPRVQPQWSHFVWRTELTTGLYENVAVPWLIHWLAGTPLMAPALRLFGAKIGRRVYMETHFLTEFDLVRVGNDASVSGQAALQTHLFEDRVMKMSTVTVGDNCTVGPRAVILYDAELESGVELEALSLAMKGEKLPAETRWRGIPASLVE